MLPSGHLVAAPLNLALGVVLLAYLVQLHRTSAVHQGPPRPPDRRPEWAVVAEWAVVFGLVGLSLFWAANDYAAAVGRGRTRQFVAQMPGYATAVVHYSARSTLGRGSC
ncbi:hypothetical protein ACIA8O_21540 [Kitasatospora sp. NPDC051853]|uniref:hypothetical protein n=1 Tax=Kitasatospora sp. NPDC051853 TaxID=3364058 RepID=UPI003793429A